MTATAAHTAYAPCRQGCYSSRRNDRKEVAAVAHKILAGAAIVTLGLASSAAGCSSSGKSSVGKGNTKHPATADLTVTSCAVDPTLKVPEAKGTIVNHSTGASDYSFTISFLNPAGTVVAQGGGLESNIAPNQTAAWSSNGDAQVAVAKVTCKVADVTRFASG